MKKVWMIFVAVFFLSPLYSQTRVLNGRVYDAATSYPVKGANVYNVNTNKHAFTDANGCFTMTVSRNDSLVVSSATYRQEVAVVNSMVFDRCRKDFYMHVKAFMLPGIKVIGLNPTYEGFKRDIAHTKLPESYKNLEDVHLSTMDRKNATYSEEAPNVLKNTAVGSPITTLYNIFNRRMKTKRLYYEMEGYGEEVQQVPLKYNKELVAQITGLEEPQLMEFMVFCRFSYYDLVRWSRDEIIAAIRYKYDEYEYYKALEDDY